MQGPLLQVACKPKRAGEAFALLNVDAILLSNGFIILPVRLTGELLHLEN